MFPTHQARKKAIRRTNTHCRPTLEMLEDRVTPAGFEFSGQITSVDPALANYFATGESFSMNIDFDTEFDDTAPGDDTLGRYYAFPPDPADYGAISQLTATVGSYSAGSPDGIIEVLDNFPNQIGDTLDRYLAGATDIHGLTGQSVGGFAPQAAEVVLIDSTHTAFSDDTLKTSLDLTAFPDANRRFNFLFRDALGTQAFVRGEVTEVVSTSVVEISTGPADGMDDEVVIEEDEFGTVRVLINGTNAFEDQLEGRVLRIIGSEDSETVSISPDATQTLRVELSAINDLKVNGSVLDGNNFNMKLGADGSGEVSLANDSHSIALLTTFDPTTQFFSLADAAGSGTVSIDPMPLTVDPTQLRLDVAGIAEFDVEGIEGVASEYCVALKSDGFGQLSLADPTRSVELLTTFDPTTQFFSVAGNDSTDDTVSVDLPMVMAGRDKVELLVTTAGIDFLTASGIDDEATDFTVTMEADGSGMITMADGNDLAEVSVRTDTLSIGLSLLGSESADDTVSIDTPMDRPDVDKIELLVETVDVEYVTIDGTASDDVISLTHLDDGGLVGAIMPLEETFEVRLTGDFTEFNVIGGDGFDTFDATYPEPDFREFTVDLQSVEDIGLTPDPDAILIGLSMPVQQTFTPSFGEISTSNLLVTHDDSVTASYIEASSVEVLVTRDSTLDKFTGDLSFGYLFTGSEGKLVFKDVEFEGKVTTEVTGAKESANTVVVQKENLVHHDAVKTTINGGEANDKVEIKHRDVENKSTSEQTIDLKDGSDEVTLDNVTAGEVKILDSGSSQDNDKLKIIADDKDNTFKVEEKAITIDSQKFEYEGQEKVELDGAGGTNKVIVEGTPTTPVTWENASGIGVTGGVLRIVGTDDDDQVSVNYRSTGVIVVHASFQAKGTFQTFNASDVNRIVADLAGGDDHMTIAHGIWIPGFILGGDGNDHLVGGGGRNVLLGGSGNDRLVGGSSSDLLIGGLGADQLNANAGRNILIAGSTAYDDAPNQVDDLFAILDDFADDGELNGDLVLDETTVFDDESIDTLLGVSSHDWLFFTEEEDKIAGR